MTVCSARDAAIASKEGSGNCSCMIDIVVKSVRLAPSSMTTDKQKVALVTGAAKRIGRAIALALARRGWDVAVHYRHSAADAQATVRDIESLGRHAIALQADLADPAALATL